MKIKYKIGVFVVVLAGLVSLTAWYLHGRSIAVLSPAGPIARQERQLIIITVLLSLLVVIPVFTMLGVFSWKYRESNKAAKYTPDWDGSRIAETIWWVVPSALILVLGVITWRSSHELDPFRPLASATPPITIQAVALDWKWLFIYPQQHIASVNLVQFPADTPVNFEITADAPMNSFWIPRLGGQIYAMPGMSTELHLMADSPGSFRGSSANLSGRGFAGMDFVAKASSNTDFKQWVNQAKQSPNMLDQAAYAKLVAPSENNPVAYYAADGTALYDSIVMKYMPATDQMSAMSGMSGMETR